MNCPDCGDRLITIEAGRPFVIEERDREILSLGPWRVQANGYVAFSSPRPSRGATYLHRALLGLRRGDGLEGDHRNRDRRDNRRCNLRISTRSSNAENVPAMGGTSPYRGVSFDRRRGLWAAQAKWRGRHVHIGRYATEAAAALAAHEWRRAHWRFYVPDAAVVALTGAK